MLSARNLIIAGAFTAAATLFSLAPALITSGDLFAQSSECSTGEEGDLYTGHCVPYLVPNTPDTAGTSANACPEGVSGAECAPPASVSTPPTPTPFQPTPELQELEDVNTPDY
ncbi:hypothetical protein [Mycolicibacterium phlei]